MPDVRFYSLNGAFLTVKRESFTSKAKAIEAINQYAAKAGFTNVKFVDDDGYDLDIRVTATTPNGRAGRNIAVIEIGLEDE